MSSRSSVTPEDTAAICNGSPSTLFSLHERSVLERHYAAYSAEPYTDGALSKLLALLDPELLAEEAQGRRLRACGYDPLLVPVVTFEVACRYAALSRNVRDRCVTKEDAETLEAFAHLGGNRDRSGFVTTEALQAVLEGFKILPDVQAVLREVDTDGSGTIEFDEFAEFYRRRAPGAGALGRTTSATSAEAFGALSELLLSGAGTGLDEWRVCGAYADRRDESTDDEYMLEDAALDASGDFEDAAGTIVAAPPAADVTSPRPALPGGETMEAPPEGSPGSSCAPLDASFLTTGSALSPSHASPTSTIGRRRAYTRRQVTEARLLSDRLRTVLGAHAARLSCVSNKYAESAAEACEPSAAAVAQQGVALHQRRASAPCPPASLPPPARRPRDDTPVAKLLEEVAVNNAALRESKRSTEIHLRTAQRRRDEIAAALDRQATPERDRPITLAPFVSKDPPHSASAAGSSCLVPPPPPVAPVEPKPRQRPTTAPLRRPAPPSHGPAAGGTAKGGRPMSARSHGMRDFGRLSAAPTMAPTSMSRPTSSSGRRPSLPSMHAPSFTPLTPRADIRLFAGCDFYSFFASTAPLSARRASAASAQSLPGGSEGVAAATTAPRRPFSANIRRRPSVQ